MCLTRRFACAHFWSANTQSKHGVFARRFQRVRSEKNIIEGALMTKRPSGGAGKARFNVATPTYEARTRPLHVQHTHYRIIFKQNPFNIISRGVQR